MQYDVAGEGEEVAKEQQRGADDEVDGAAVGNQLVVALQNLLVICSYDAKVQLRTGHYVICCQAKHARRSKKERC